MKNNKILTTIILIINFLFFIIIVPSVLSTNTIQIPIVYKPIQSVSAPFNTQVNVTSVNIINITNNITNNNYITNNITNTINITNNVTNFVLLNITNNVTTYVTNNITNNLTNVVTFFSYENNTYNITNYVTNNFTSIIIFNATNNITNNFTYITNITNNFTTPFNYSEYFNQGLNTTSNVQFNSILNYNTTTQLKSYFDTLYYSILNPLNFINNSVSNLINYYNITYIDNLYSVINTSFYPISNNPKNYYNGSGTNNFISMFNGSQLVNSPIKQFITDEVGITIFNTSLYIDSTNQEVGVNIVEGSESHAQSFVVSSLERIQSGRIVSISYNSTSNLTIIQTNESLPEYFVDAGHIRVNNISDYYVFNKINSTQFYILGNVTNLNSSNWTYKQAPYIDVNGHDYEERGYTISTDGTWMWAIYSPHHSNTSEFCVQNRNAWFNNQTDAFCINSNGDMIINGRLLADGYYFGLYNNTPISITMTTNGVWYNITSWDSDISSGWTINSNYATCIQSGTYKITFSYAGSVNNNDNINFKVLVNGIDINKSIIVNRMSNGLQSITSWDFLYKFKTGDIVSTQIMDSTRNGAVFTFDERNINAVRIGN